MHSFRLRARVISRKRQTSDIVTSVMHNRIILFFASKISTRFFRSNNKTGTGSHVSAVRSSGDSGIVFGKSPSRFRFYCYCFTVTFLGHYNFTQQEKYYVYVNVHKSIFHDVGYNKGRDWYLLLNIPCYLWIDASFLSQHSQRIVMATTGSGSSTTGICFFQNHRRDIWFLSDQARLRKGGVQGISSINSLFRVNNSKTSMKKTPRSDTVRIVI